MNNAFSIINAKQGPSALRGLIELRCATALPIAGRYRIIDVLLSNLTNSGIKNVGVITQRNYQSLMGHLGSGKEWDMSKKSGGLKILPPYDLSTESELYHGFPDALLSKRDFIQNQRARYCILCSTDQVYRQDFNVLMEQHMQTGADISVMYTRNPRLMNDKSGTVTFLEIEDGRVKDLFTSDTGSDSCYANMHVCLMDKDLLIQLVEDTCVEGGNDFDRDLLKRAIGTCKVMGVEHRGYVGLVTSVKTYFDLNQDMLDREIRYEVFDPNFPVYTKIMDEPPTRFVRGCEVVHSLFGNGCDIRGRVKNSIVFRGVEVDESADVENCIVMQNSKIGAGAKLCNMIIDKNVVVEPGVRLISLAYDPKIIHKGSVVEGSAR